MAKSKRASSAGGSLLEIVLIVAVALGLALGIQAFLVKPYRIPSESMVPTLEIGQRVLVNRIGMRFGDPDVGDVVVFHPPAGAIVGRCGAPRRPGRACPRPTGPPAREYFIKRVVGLPGDRLAVRDNRVHVNGRRMHEPFVAAGTPCDELCNLPREITVPAGHVFMMGDNRGQSADSREWGPVPEEWIVGSAFFTYWPPRRVGTL